MASSSSSSIPAQNSQAGEKRSETLELTKAEAAEVEARPLRREWTDFTEEQLRVRIGIAQKCEARLAKHCDWSLRDAYEKRPLWRFYTGEEGRTIKRIYSTPIREAAIPFVCVASCFTMWTSKAGELPNELLVVERWSSEQLERIRLNDAPGVFVDPLGFLLLLPVVWEPCPPGK